MNKEQALTILKKKLKDMNDLEKSKIKQALELVSGSWTKNEHN